MPAHNPRPCLHITDDRARISPYDPPSRLDECCSRYRIEPSVLLVPVATLFAFTELWGTMPGAPASFGTIIDFVGTLPALAFLVMTTMICLAFFLFSEGHVKGSANRVDASSSNTLTNRTRSDTEAGNPKDPVRANDVIDSESTDDEQQAGEETLEAGIELRTLS